MKDKRDMKEDVKMASIWMSGQCEKVLYTLLHCLRQNVLPQGGDKAGQKA